MENWKLLLAGIRNALSDLVNKTFNIKGEVSVSNLPAVQHVVIDNQQEPTEKVEVSNLVDYKEELNKIIGELIKVPKDIKTADYSPIIKALQDVVKTLEADKTDYSPIILSISSAVKELKDAYPTFNVEPIVNTIKGLQQFNLDQYLKYGELPVVINAKQYENLIKAFGKQVAVAIQEGGGGSTVTATVDTTGLATSTIQTNGSQKTKVVDSAGTVQDWAMPEGQEASANSMPMVLSTEQEAILNAIKTSVETLDNAISGSEMQIDVVGSLPAGTQIIGKVGIDQTTDGTTNKVYIGNSTSNPVPVQPPAVGYLPVSSTPATSGGLLIANFTSGDGTTALTNSAQVIKASAGQLFGWYIFNPNTVTAWVIFYNTAAASVTVGTTNPVLVIGVPAGAAANVVNPMGIEFTNAGWSCAAVMTAANGNTAPTTALDVNIFYK